MGSLQVYVGQWQDYSEGSAAQSTVITLDVRSAGLLIAALSVWVTLVGGAFWTLCALAIHQCFLTKSRPMDAFRIQQRVLLANPIGPLAAIEGLWNICLAWRPLQGDTRIKGRKLRTSLLILPATMVACGFTAASVLVSNVAGESYLSNNVRLSPKNCGTFIYDPTLAGNRAGVQRILDDTITGRAYADSCYGANQDPGKCSLYPVSAISYTTSQISCPFGKDIYGSSLCVGTQAQAFMVDTGLVDTDKTLGINAVAGDRVLVRKTVTCSPINVIPYISSDNHTTPLNFLNVGPVFGVSNYTFQYHTQAKSDGFGYQLFTVAASPEVWTPIEPLLVQYGDVGIVVLTSNSVRYLAPVEDVWFSASTPTDPGSDLRTEYTADNNITAMGCIDKMQICNPVTRSCTVLSGWLDNFNSYQSLGMNDNQQVTAWRLLQVLGGSATFWSINGLGDNALLARRNVLQGVSSGLPRNQWQNEVRGWFETSLAKIQANVVDYVIHSEDLGPSGRFYTPNSSSAFPLEQAAAAFCLNQRVRNTGGYQTFYLVGIVIVVGIGLVIIIASLLVPLLVGWVHRRGLGRKKDEHREIARVADGTLQLLMTALQGPDLNLNKVWERTLREVPVASGMVEFPPPQCEWINGAEYFRHQPILKATSITENNSTTEMAIDSSQSQSA